MIPDRFIGVQAIAVYPSRFVPPSLENIQYNITGDAVERFLSAIDFNHPINGQLLGAKYNAYIYLKFPDSIGEYAVCCDYDYFLKLDRWDDLYDVDYALKQTLRMMVSEFPANSDAIRPGIPI